MSAAEAINNYMGYTSQRKEPSKDMDKELFMKLLIAQLQNQDPTNESQDPSVMVQQMTAFSQLEQLQTLGTLLNGIQEQNVALFQSSATSLVGKTVRVQGAGVPFEHGKASVGMDLEANAKVTLVLKDEAGRRLASVDLGEYKMGHHTISLSGLMDELGEGTYFILDDAGNPLPNGTYYIEYMAFDEQGNQVTANSTSDLVVESVAFADKTVLIYIGGNYYSLGDVIEVRA